ncbi:hypothetical protein [Thalassospira xiamenensis]|uniref:CYTH domain-containing protein n=1 Tax=Thalassospira xiamenensis TaxID=220697 RepID=A0A285TXK0_9PROT|nr:hypothetical protein [Thalassospira xiamenensis]SOC30532.1 hypothetical protein SAMN05428964_10983 [Thalassospira xiamenensis]
MAIENEIKFALKNADSLEERLFAAFGPSEIRQCYIYPDLRARSSKSVQDKNFSLTFKRRLPDGQSVEIETDLTEAEFQLFWNDTKVKLQKRRFSYIDDQFKWDIDFFKDDKGITYCAVAEVEMPENMKPPVLVPEFLLDYVYYPVVQGDSRFNSFKLADQDYARLLFEEILA